MGAFHSDDLPSIYMELASPAKCQPGRQSTVARSWHNAGTKFNLDKIGKPL